MKRKHKSKKVVQPPMTEAELAKEGIKPQVYKRRWWILGSLCLALFVEMVANGSLNMALPDMARVYESFTARFNLDCEYLYLAICEPTFCGWCCWRSIRSQENHANRAGAI